MKTNEFWHENQWNDCTDINKLGVAKNGQKGPALVKNVRPLAWSEAKKGGMDGSTEVKNICMVCKAQVQV